MDLELTGRVALVTAASKGLGRATATQLAAEGARVMISSRGADQLARTAQEIADATGAQVEHCPADVADAADLDRLLRETQERLGGVDVLVNNAGGPPPGGFDALDDAMWQQAFELNLLSTVRLFRGVLPHMREQGWGRIVTIASSSIRQPIDDLTLSNTFRVGLLGLAKSVALEVAGDGVLVNTVGPGRIATDRIASMAGSMEAAEAAAAELVPAGRLGTVEEFASVAAFLCSARAAYVTGTAVLVDGGLTQSI
jgi:3-oxoacyl-[acyl-carrier protein] reductase